MPFIDPYFGSIYWKRSFPRSNGQTNAQIRSFGNQGVYFYDYNKVKKNYKKSIIHNNVQWNGNNNYFYNNYNFNKAPVRKNKNKKNNNKNKNNNKIYTREVFNTIFVNYQF